MASVAWPVGRKPLVWLSRFRSLIRRTPFETLTEAGRAQERYRRVVLTTLTSLGVRGCTAITALISVPLTLKYLGMERYGLWVTISSIVAMLAFADFGIGNGLLNAVALTTGKGERDRMRQFVSSALFLLSGAAGLFAVLFALTYRWIPWAGLFNVKSAVARSESGPAMIAFAVCFLLSLPLGIVQRIQIGSQEGFVNDIWLSAGSLFSLLALVIGVYFKWTLPFLILAVSGAPVVAMLLNCVSLFGWSRRWLMPRWSDFQWAAAKILARQGFLFFLLQIGFVVSMSSDNLIVAQVLGAAAVPRYAVTQRVFLLVAGLQNAWLSPLWPAYGEALQRGDIVWVRKTLARSIRAAVLITGVLSLALVAVSRPLFRFWVGPDLIPSWPLTIGFALWAVTQAGGTAVAMFLNGTNTLQFELCVSIALVVVGTPLKILLCRQAGMTGIVWGQLIAYLLVVALPFVFVLPKIIGKHAKIHAGNSAALARG